MPVSVIIARDPLLIDEAAAAAAPAEAELKRCYAEELDYDVIFSHLGSGNLFDERQAFHYVNFLSLKLKKQEQQSMAALLKALPDVTTLVCSQLIADSPGKRSAQITARREYKLVAEYAVVQDLTELSDEPKAARWLAERSLARYGLSLRQHQAAGLYRACAGSLAMADAELRKLHLLKQDDKPQPVPDKLLESIVSSNPTAQFYQVADSIMSGDPGAAAGLRHWHGIDGDTFRLVGELRRRLLGIYDLSNNREVMPPYLKRQLSRAAHRYQGDRLGRALELLAQLELNLKSGAVPGYSSSDAELTALETFTVQLGTMLSAR